MNMLCITCVCYKKIILLLITSQNTRDPGATILTSETTAITDQLCFMLSVQSVQII